MSNLERFRSYRMGRDRKEPSGARKARKEVQLEAAITEDLIDAAYEVAEYAMDGILDLDNRRQMKGATEGQNKFLLAPLQITAMQQVQRHQQRMFKGWGD